MVLVGGALDGMLLDVTGWPPQEVVHGFVHENGFWPISCGRTQRDDWSSFDGG
ncbi:hypothetical protein ACFY7H_29360 [Streptomyces sp. NPDC012794]|uniref:hypothetical protein n=1 Tax=Streptomyces sp. NPDC012794 TaxID=3364850 RepID=UPI0036C91B3D